MILSSEDLQALLLTFRLAGVSVAILLLLGTPLAYWLARTQKRWLRTTVEALVALPLILPPTVLGFYLLIMLGNKGILGRLTASLGLAPLAFSFSGLVIGSVLYSLPFVVQPLQNAFRAIPQGVLEAASTLRASPLDRFFSLCLPLALPGYLTAAVLGFAHTLGEFGVVLMIGGNIPGRTRVISVAIYDHVEALQYEQAAVLSLVLLCISFVLLFVIYFCGGRFSPLKSQ